MGRLHHVDLTVADLERSIAFYGPLLARLGFRHHGPFTPNNADWISDSISIGLVRAHPGHARHDRYSPGLHHLAFDVGSREEVDALYVFVKDMGAAILDPPRDYPQYEPGYYAVFFADPDGLKLEIVHTPGWRPR